MFFLQPLIAIYVLFNIIHVLNGYLIGKKSKVLLIFILFSQLLSLNSALQVFFIIFISILLISPGLYRVQLSEIRVKYLFLIVILTPVACVGVLVIGLGNKVGFGFLLSSEGLVYFNNSIGSIISRISSSLMAAATVYDCCLFDDSLSLTSYEGMAETISNRFQLIQGSDDFDKEIIKTVSRENFLLVFQGYIARAGASPGVLASIIYMPIYPLGFVILPIIHVIIARIISYQLNSNIKYNMLSMLAIPYFILPFFEAPLNIFYVLDPLFISLLFLFCWRFINVKKLFSK
jgi:hypothetical protein